MNDGRHLPRVIRRSADVASHETLRRGIEQSLVGMIDWRRRFAKRTVAERGRSSVRREEIRKPRPDDPTDGP